MYIRRKVFSVAEDMYGDERYFSTTDIDLGFSDYDDNFYDERDFSDYYDYDYDDFLDERIYAELITDKKTGKQFIKREGELIPLDSLEGLSTKEAAAFNNSEARVKKINAKNADAIAGNVTQTGKTYYDTTGQKALDKKARRRATSKQYKAVQDAKKRGESFISDNYKMKEELLKGHKKLKESLANEIAGRAADKAAAAEAFKKQAAINSERMAKQIAANRKLRKLGIAGAIGAGVVGTGAGYLAGRNSK